jgi:hypothetical protein
MTLVKKLGEKKVNILSEVLCNYCGKSIPETVGIPGQFEYALLQAWWGYGSKHDTDKFNIDFCEECVYDEILPKCVLRPEITQDVW